MSDTFPINESRKINSKTDKHQILYDFWVSIWPGIVWTNKTAGKSPLRYLLCVFLSNSGAGQVLGLGVYFFHQHKNKHKNNINHTLQVQNLTNRLNITYSSLTLKTQVLSAVPSPSQDTKHNNFFLIQSSNTKNDPHRNTLSKNNILHQIYLLFVGCIRNHIPLISEWFLWK